MLDWRKSDDFIVTNAVRVAVRKLDLELCLVRLTGPKAVFEVRTPQGDALADLAILWSGGAFDLAVNGVDCTSAEATIQRRVRASDGDALDAAVQVLCERLSALAPVSIPGMAA